jgi:hypothetical protein
LPPASRYDKLFTPGWSGTWVVNPNSRFGPIFMSINNLIFPDDCSDLLNIYANYSSSFSLLYSSCGSSNQNIGNHPSNSSSRLLSSNWIATDAPIITVAFRSNTASTGKSNFEISYTTDGTNYNCGITRSPAKFTAASFAFTDGSSSSETLYPFQNCQWLIEPIAISNDNKTDGTSIVLVDFMYCNLTGARLAIYDGFDADSGVLLWECNGCVTVPPQLVSSSGSVYVDYISTGASIRGNGFGINYWSIAMPSQEWKDNVQDSTIRSCSRYNARSGAYENVVGGCNASSEVILEMPLNFTFNEDIYKVGPLSPVETAWILNYPIPGIIVDANGISSYSRISSILSFWPSYTFQEDNSSFSKSLKSKFQDGRINNTMLVDSALFRRLNANPSRFYCGTWHTEIPVSDIGQHDFSVYSRANDTASSPTLIDVKNGFKYRSSQAVGNNGLYFATSHSMKDFHGNMILKLSNFAQNTNPTSAVSIPSPSNTCKYAVDTTNAGRLPSKSLLIRVLKSTCGTSSLQRLRIYGGLFGNDSMIYDSAASSFAQEKILIAPCGKATILYENYNNSVSPDSCGFDLEYDIDTTDVGAAACQKYGMKSVVLIFLT